MMPPTDGITHHLRQVRALLCNHDLASFSDSDAEKLLQHVMTLLNSKSPGAVSAPGETLQGRCKCGRWRSRMRGSGKAEWRETQARREGRQPAPTFCPDCGYYLDPFGVDRQQGVGERVREVLDRLVNAANIYTQNLKPKGFSPNTIEGVGLDLVAALAADAEAGGDGHSCDDCSHCAPNGMRDCGPCPRYPHLKDQWESREQNALDAATAATQNGE